MDNYLSGEQTRKCNKCGQQRALSEFRKLSRSKTGFRSYCKACEAKDARERKSIRKNNQHCTQCNKPLIDKSKSLCLECLNKKSEYLRNKYKNTQARGTCFICSNVLDSNNNSNLCERCLAKARKREFEKRKLFCIKVGNYFNNRCYICGIKSNEHQIYDCHHIDPKQKDINVSKLWKKPFDMVLLELQKCIYTCSNCHRRLHYGYLDEFIKSSYLEIIPGRDGILSREALQKWLTI